MMIKPDSEYHQVNHYTQLTKKGYELIIDSDGDKLYYLNGQYHRENAPAATKTNGYQAWYTHHKLHNLNGPAKIFPNGNKYYWIYNKYYEENEFWTVQKKCFKCHQIFNNLYDLKVHLEQYNDAKNMIEYIYKLLLK